MGLIQILSKKKSNSGFISATIEWKNDVIFDRVES